MRKVRILAAIELLLKRYFTIKGSLSKKEAYFQHKGCEAKSAVRSGKYERSMLIQAAAVCE
uniref:Uncharacterized protein n=1 Tax=Wuchereria bancrofti TaxID=6293 RepID=A0A1I8EIE8_WUCBA